MRRFGSRVTLVERGGQLLGREDEDVAAAIAEILREDGIEIIVDGRVRGVERLGNGGVRVRAREPERDAAGTRGRRPAALGRTPATEGVGLDTAAVELDEHREALADFINRQVEIDEATSVPKPLVDVVELRLRHESVCGDEVRRMWLGAGLATHVGLVIFEEPEQFIAPVPSPVTPAAARLHRPTIERMARPFRARAGGRARPARLLRVSVFRAAPGPLSQRARARRSAMAVTRSGKAPSVVP